MTLKNDKEIFEFVKDKLLKQYARSMDTDDTCRYRGLSTRTIDNLKNNLAEANGLSVDEYEDVMTNDEFYEGYLEAMCSINEDAKCAVGHLISDEFYSPNFEGETIEYGSDIWDAVISSNPEWKISDNSFKLLSTLQAIHDRQRVEDWEESFKRLENDFLENGDYDPYINV